MTREPGDLPSFVVTRDSVGRGVLRRSKAGARRIMRGGGMETFRSDGPRLLRAQSHAIPILRHRDPLRERARPHVVIRPYALAFADSRCWPARCCSVLF